MYKVAELAWSGPNNGHQFFLNCNFLPQRNITVAFRIAYKLCLPCWVLLTVCAPSTVSTFYMSSIKDVLTTIGCTALWGISWLFHSVHWRVPPFPSSFHSGSLCLPAELWKGKLKFHLNTGYKAKTEWIKQEHWCWQLEPRLELHWIISRSFGHCRIISSQIFLCVCN